MILPEALKISRNLAKSNEYQLLYSAAKELNLELFKNKGDLSLLQLQFLSFLNFYATLYMDIYLNEVDEIVLTNFIYEDAYTYYKEKQRKKETSISNIQPDPNKSVDKIQQTKSQWRFRRPA